MHPSPAGGLGNGAQACMSLASTAFSSSASRARLRTRCSSLARAAAVAAPSTRRAAPRALGGWGDLSIARPVTLRTMVAGTAPSGAAAAEVPVATPVSSLLTQAAKLRPRSGKARRAAGTKRKARAARSEPQSRASKTEDLGALLDAVAAGELDDSHVSPVLDWWVAAQGGEECLSPEVVGLAIRAYSLAGKHHLAASVFRAFESEQLPASAYAALARSCLTTGDADTGISLIHRLEQADMAMSPRVYEVLVRAALVSCAAADAARAVHPSFPCASAGRHRLTSASASCCRRRRALAPVAPSNAMPEPAASTCLLLAALRRTRASGSGARDSPVPVATALTAGSLWGHSPRAGRRGSGQARR